MNTHTLSLSFAGLLFAACAPDAVIESMDINLGVNDADISGSAMLSQKNINTENGNPFGLFLGEIESTNLKDFLISLDNATITLESADAQHSTFESFYEGTLDLVIIDETSGTSTIAATIDDPTGVGPLELNVDNGIFDDAVFQGTLSSGSFKMGLSGTTAANIGNGLNANVVLTLGFSAAE